MIRVSADVQLNPDVGPQPDDDVRLGLDLVQSSELRRLVESAPDGIAIVDATSRRYVYVNPVGCLLLRRSLSELLGSSSQFALEPLDARSRAKGLIASDEFEHSTTNLSGFGRKLFAVYFRDVSTQRQHARLLRAFSRTSASVAFAGSLASVLDRMAEETKHATGMASCTFLLMHDDGHLSQAGITADSYPGVTDYAQRLERCRALGAPLLSLAAFNQHEPFVARNWRRQTLADPRFEPLHDISAGATWDTLVTVPLMGRGKILGVLNGYYAADSILEDEELEFLTAIANQAAVAVENSALLGAVEKKAALEERHLIARELHDSVNQALFSLTLHTRAMELAATAGRLEFPQLLNGLSEVRQLTEGALAEMRALIFQLRPAALREEGLVLAVRKHAAGVTAKEGLEIHVSGPAERLPLDQLVEEELFRVVREALHNVVKHAQARSARIVVASQPARPNMLSVVVHDDGIGFNVDEPHPGHLGLESMAERVAAVGGALTIHSKPGCTTVHADIPLLAGYIGD